jgi:amidase
VEGHSNQQTLEAALDINVSAKEYESYFKHMRTVGRERGIDHILEKYDVDIILGPTDSFLSTLASASGRLPPR